MTASLQAGCLTAAPAGPQPAADKRGAGTTPPHGLSPRATTATHGNDSRSKSMKDLMSSGKILRQGTYDIGEVADGLFGLVRIGR